MGAVFEFLQTTLAVICIVVVPCALFVVYQIVQLIRTVKHGKKSEENQKNEELMMEDKLSNIQTPTIGAFQTKYFATVCGNYTINRRTRGGSKRIIQAFIK